MRRLIKALRNALKRRARLCAAVLLIAAVLCGTSSYESPASAGSEICFTAAEADSVLSLVEYQEERIRLLEIDLWECRHLARSDSLWGEERINLVTRHYESVIEGMDGKTWLDRTVKHPMVWFVLGTYLGVRATDGN